jgi:hypothetical protein
MKLIVFILLVCNLVLLSVQWLNIRSNSAPLLYVEKKESQRLELLKEIVLDEANLLGGSDMCSLLGPLETQAMAKQILAALNGAGIESSLVEQKINKTPSYWVYFDEFSEGVVASAQLAEFRRKGIDSYLVASGELKGALSLGVFENTDLAHKLKRNLLKKGYGAKIYEFYRLESEYWLLLSSGYDDENKEEIDSILKPLKKSSEIRQIICKSVASEK